MIIDGKKLAETVRGEVKLAVEAFTKEHGRAPGLEVVLVGEDPASQVYTRNKEKAAKEVGIRGVLHTLPATTTCRAGSCTGPTRRTARRRATSCRSRARPRSPTATGASSMSPRQ